MKLPPIYLYKYLRRHTKRALKQKTSVPCGCLSSAGHDQLSPVGWQPAEAVPKLFAFDPRQRLCCLRRIALSPLWRLLMRSAPLNHTVLFTNYMPPAR